MMIGCKEPRYIVAVELWCLIWVGTCCHVTSDWFAVQISATRYCEVTSTWSRDATNTLWQKAKQQETLTHYEKKFTKLMTFGIN